MYVYHNNSYEIRDWLQRNTATHYISVDLCYAVQGKQNIGKGISGSAPTSKKLTVSCIGSTRYINTVSFEAA